MPRIGIERAGLSQLTQRICAQTLQFGRQGMREYHRPGRVAHPAPQLDADEVANPPKTQTYRHQGRHEVECIHHM